MNPSKFTPPLSPFSSEVAVLEFRTEVTWTAYDLGRILSALDSIYSSFILARHLGVMANQRIQRSEEQLGRFWEMIEREGPHLDMLFHEWHRMLRRYGPGAASLLTPFGSLGGQAVDRLAQVLPQSEVEYYASNPSEYLPSTHELRIKKIAMASPGGFSLEGLGEPLRELREFIKDLCYRNRQERQKGDLEILKQKLDIAAQHNLSPMHVQIIAESTLPEAEEVAEIMGTGHLLLEDSNHTQNDSATAQRAPKRKRKPRRKNDERNS